MERKLCAWKPGEPSGFRTFRMGEQKSTHSCTHVRPGTLFGLLFLGGRWNPTLLSVGSMKWRLWNGVISKTQTEQYFMGCKKAVLWFYFMAIFGWEFLKAWHSDGWRVSFLFCEIFNSSKSQKDIVPQIGRPEILPKLLNSCGKFLKACNRSKWSIWDLASFSQNEIHWIDLLSAEFFGKSASCWTQPL